MRELWLREVKTLAQGYVAGRKWQREHLISVPSDHSAVKRSKLLCTPAVHEVYANSSSVKPFLKIQGWILSLLVVTISELMQVPLGLGAIPTGKGYGSYGVLLSPSYKRREYLSTLSTNLHVLNTFSYTDENLFLTVMSLTNANCALWVACK